MPSLLAGVGEFLERVALERRGLDAPIGERGAEHAEAVVMLAGDDDVFHAGVLGGAHPVVGVEFHRIELRHELGVLESGIFVSFMIHSPAPDVGLPSHAPAGTE